MSVNKSIMPRWVDTGVCCPQDYDTVASEINHVPIFLSNPWPHTIQQLYDLQYKYKKYKINGTITFSFSYEVLDFCCGSYTVLSSSTTYTMNELICDVSDRAKVNHSHEGFSPDFPDVNSPTERKETVCCQTDSEYFNNETDTIPDHTLLCYQFKKNVTFSPIASYHSSPPIGSNTGAAGCTGYVCPANPSGTFGPGTGAGDAVLIFNIFGGVYDTPPCLLKKLGEPDDIGDTPYYPAIGFGISNTYGAGGVIFTDPNTSATDTYTIRNVGTATIIGRLYQLYQLYPNFLLDPLSNTEGYTESLNANFTVEVDENWPDF